MTQREADRLIEYRITRAASYEAKRDALPYQSPEYWAMHDKAIEWHGRAELMMPMSCRTISI